MNEAVNSSQVNQKKQILKTISGKVDLPRVSRRYVFGLFLTACAVMLPPLLYCALMALALGFVFAFIQHADSIMNAWNPATKMLTRGLVISCGSAFVLGLLKPFLARSSAIKRPRTLRRDAEPFLYEYVDRLCDALGACRPTDIHITCELNAGAEFQRVWPGLFGNGKISLHLGLPLIAGLTLSQFTGVLAHELGHFTQRTAMWLENLVRRTNQWLLQSAYERDSIDDWLDRQCAMRGPMAILSYIVCGVVWLTRRIVLGLALAGNAISGLMSREMEFNADLCQVRTIGTRTFASTMWRMRQLTVAHQMSLRDIASFYAEGRLPDNMIALSEANTSFVTPKVKKKLRRMMVEEKTGLFDSHPSDRDRIQAANTDGSPGFFRPGSLSNNLPASILFSHFEEISRFETTRFYERALNQPIKPRMLHPVGKLLERQNAQIESSKALRRYFQTDIPVLRPLPIAPQSADHPENPEEVISELNTCRERMIAELPNYKRLSPRYQSAEETFFETIAAQSLLQARLQFKPSDYHLDQANADAVADKLARAREGVTNLAGKLLAFESEAGNRLSFALQLLHVPEIAQNIPQGDDLQYEIQSLLPEAQYVSRLIGELPSLRIVFYRLIVLIERMDGKKTNQRVLEMIMTQMTTLRNRLVSIQAEMGSHLYPFDHAQAETTLQKYALPQIPGERDLGGLVQVTDHMQSRLLTIQVRLFARLAQAAEKIESAVGMPALSEPDEVDVEV